MATIVCQGLQSCLESQLVESRTLRLKLSSPKPPFSQSLELALKPCSLDSETKELNTKQTSSVPNPDIGGWSFLEILQRESTMEKVENAYEYVNPVMKRYPSTLSEKSLELCTENLGCETGSDVLENMIVTSVGNSPTGEQQKPRQLLGAKRECKTNCHSFPPPLTTMSGSESLQVRSHREDGRLVIKAVKAPTTLSCFHAERSHGRLRLAFVKDSASKFDYPNAEENEEETENDIIYDDDGDGDEDDEEEEESAEEDEFEIEFDGKDTEGNNLEVGGELGIEEFQRPSRCKEGELENKGLLSWEPFWVAT